jgi:hypothetical protein
VLWAEGENHNNHDKLNLKNSNETQNSSRTLQRGAAQRDGSLARGYKKRIEDGLESEYRLNERIEDEILPKLAEERGATLSIEKVRRLRKELKEAEATLGKLGFACDDDADDLSLAEEAPKGLQQALEKAQRSARNERQAQLLKYDKAILIVWAAQNADEVKRTVEELL